MQHSHRYKHHFKHFDRLEFHTIFGEAGTGKSTLLASRINEIAKYQNFIVLAFTHSAVNTIYNKCRATNPNIDRSKFRTICSYFHMDWKNGYNIGGMYRIVIPNHIFIDEFSLINRNAFNNILTYLNDILTFENPYDPCVVTIAGDAMQLNAIYDDNEKFTLGELYYANKLIHKGDVNDDVSNSVNDGVDNGVDNYANGGVDNSVNIHCNKYVLEHVMMSIFVHPIIRNSKFEHLTVNYRSNNIVMSTLRAIYAKDDKFKYKFLPRSEIVGRMLNGYTFIASQYKFIESVYESIANYWIEHHMYELEIVEQTTNKGLQKLYLYPGMLVTVTETGDDYVNSEDLIFLRIEDERLVCIRDGNDMTNTYVDTQASNVCVDTQVSNVCADTHADNDVKHTCESCTDNTHADNTCKHACKQHADNTQVSRTYKHTCEPCTDNTCKHTCEPCYDNTYVDNDDKHTHADQSSLIYISRIEDGTNSYYPILPANMITVHRSQGKGYDNVIVCVDNLFDICMLYTAVTRARKEVLFYSTVAISRNDYVLTLLNNAHCDEFNMLRDVITRMCEKQVSTHRLTMYVDT